MPVTGQRRPRFPSTAPASVPSAPWGTKRPLWGAGHRGLLPQTPPASCCTSVTPDLPSRGNTGEFPRPGSVRRTQGFVQGEQAPPPRPAPTPPACGGPATHRRGATPRRAHEPPRAAASLPRLPVRPPRRPAAAPRRPAAAAAGRADGEAWQRHGGVGWLVGADDAWPAARTLFPAAPPRTRQREECRAVVGGKGGRWRAHLARKRGRSHSSWQRQRRRPVVTGREAVGVIGRVNGGQRGGEYRWRRWGRRRKTTVGGEEENHI